MVFLSKFLENEQCLEDEHLAEEYFNAVFIDEMISTLFITLSIGSGIFNMKQELVVKLNVMNLVILMMLLI